jgi:hypothetical protein
MQCSHIVDAPSVVPVPTGGTIVVPEITLCLVLLQLYGQVLPVGVVCFSGPKETILVPVPDFLMGPKTVCKPENETPFAASYFFSYFIAARVYETKAAAARSPQPAANNQPLTNRVHLCLCMLALQFFCFALLLLLLSQAL